MNIQNLSIAEKEKLLLQYGYTFHEVNNLFIIADAEDNEDGFYLEGSLNEKDDLINEAFDALYLVVIAEEENLSF